MSEEGSAVIPDLGGEFLEVLAEVDPTVLRQQLAEYLEMWVSRQKDPVPGLAFDGRTGLYDAEGLTREFERLVGEHETIAVIAVTIDFFSALVERFGPETGGEILASVASFIYAAANAHDACFRQGEAEFLVLCPDRETVGAFRLAERIRSNITARSYGFFRLQVTASLGVAVYPSHATQPDSLLQLARSSARLAEELGRDRTVVYEPDHSAVGKLSRSPSGSCLHNLPLPVTPFVGRGSELAEIERLLADPACRLLTLSGPGGIGKTRLALEAAARLISRFSFGVFMVPLDSLPSPDLVANSVADSLGFSFYSPDDHRSQIISFLKNKEALLLMDNFEGVLPATGLLADILAAAPRVKVLATSRVRLDLQGEWILEVGGMACPHEEEGEEAAGEPEAYDAVQLFLQGARRVNPAFFLTPEDRYWMTHICRLLEGSPLAIELASSWARLLPLPDIAREIERDLDFLSTTRADVPERHRSMRVIFEHSWQMLEADEAACFSALSVFAGGFRREAAQVVAGATLLRLASLVDKSLVHRNPNGRYETHALLRQYAQEKLSAEPGMMEKVRDAHCACFADFLKRREAPLEGMLQKETLQEIGEEIENVRAAWNRAVQEGRRSELGMALESLYIFYDIRGWLEEGVTALGRAAEVLRGDVSGTEGDVVGRERILTGRVLARQGRFYRRLGDYRRAWDLLEESLAIFRSSGEKREEAVSLLWLGNVAESRGEYDRAEEEYGKSLHIFRIVGERGGIADALKDLGNVAHARGEYAAAREHYQESLDLYQGDGDLRGISATLNNLGVVAEFLGENVEAMRLYQESLGIDREIGEQVGIATSLINLGDIACSMGKFADARKYFYEALKLSTRAIALPVAVEVLGGIARMLAWEGKREKALELAFLAYSHPACDKEDRDRVAILIGRLEAELPEPVAREAEQRGRSLLLDEAVARILSSTP
jgi:diguanylate cyclase (GGDEF)-like protein